MWSTPSSTPRTTKAVSNLRSAWSKLAQQWKALERETLSLIEEFQNGHQNIIVALKGSQKETPSETKLVQDLYERIPTGFGHRSFQDLFSNEEMNAMHIEDIFSQILLRKEKFQQILYEMYVTYENSRINVHKAISTFDTIKENSEIFRDIGHKLQFFEAAYQHVESVLHLISFDLTEEQLMCLHIVWAISPFAKLSESI